MNTVQSTDTSAAAIAPAALREFAGAKATAVATRYVVTVDTEEEWNWNSGWPTGKPSVENIALLADFQDHCDRHHAAVTYFANHAVLDDDRAADTLLAIAGRRGVEIGMHIHPWNTPPLSDDPATARNSFLENLEPDVIRAKLETVYRRFLDRGLRPTSFRGGRYSSGPLVQEFLAEKGFVADSSVVPFTTWPDDGAPDYRHRGLEPARVVRGGRPLWEVPLTMAFTRRPFPFWRKVLAGIEHSPLRHLRLIGIAERLNLVRRVWLSFEDPLGMHMLQLLRKLRPLQLPYVCFSLHSSSLQPGANGCYVHTAADRQRLFAQLDEVLSTIAGWPEFQPATVSAIAQHLEEQYQ